MCVPPSFQVSQFPSYIDMSPSRAGRKLGPQCVKNYEHLKPGLGRRREPNTKKLKPGPGNVGRWLPEAGPGQSPAGP